MCLSFALYRDISKVLSEFIETHATDADSRLDLMVQIHVALTRCASEAVIAFARQELNRDPTRWDDDWSQVAREMMDVGVRYLNRIETERDQ